ncbi:MAG: hypothetical protein E2P02_26200 [Acidobacteria bacterium]|nr:MAG: hypothetical protein E2P02_26200 [Acidobacteriota bacterium]
MTRLFVALVLLAVQPAQPVQIAEPVQELSWPREYPGDNGAKLVLYQPQIESWDDQTRVGARLALAYSSSESAPPVFGAFEIAADTEVDLDNRKVRITRFEILKASFPSLPPGSTKTSNELRAEVESHFPADGIIVSLDRVLANLDRGEAQLAMVPLATEPPKIFVSRRPTILVLIDGEPVEAPIGELDLRFVVNTNWDLFVDPRDGRYYLLDEDGWLGASSLKSSWSPAASLPGALSNLPDDDNWKSVRENVPGRAVASADVPIVYVSEEPSELILIDGEPDMGMVPETELLWVKNTESDLLFHQGDEHYYYLVAGRWFRTSSLEMGAWTFASKDLPKDFENIPESHPRARVLPSVPGTPQADEAILLAQIPQKATVARDAVTPPVVVYQGEPQFEPVNDKTGTTMAYAINTGNDVLRVDERYYLCFEGVWFVSTSPSGGWEVADEIPDEIQTIPPSSPLHHTSYVSVYDATSTHVTFGYTAGYVGVYYSWGSVAFGTGFYYPPYYYGGGFYPVYYPYPHTYGAAAFYNPYTGTYGRAARAYGPYGGMGRSAAYNPRTGTYARGASAWGPYGASGFAEAYNPRTGTYARTRQGASPYARWGSSAVRQGDDWARTARAATPSRGIAAYQTSSGSSGAIVRNQGNVYAGKDGNVYRRSDGGWQKYDNGSWSQAERQRQAQSVDGSTMNQLNRDFQGRATGAARAQGYQNWRAGGGARRGAGRRRR